MSAKKFCCLVTVTAMLFFGLPAVPFANVDQATQLSQEELGLVFQNSKITWKEKPDFLKYLDEQEMKDTKGKAAHIVAGVVVGGIVGGIGALATGGNVLRGVTGGALAGATTLGIGGLGVGLATGTRVLNTVGIGIGAGSAAYFGCSNMCHSIRPQGGH